MPKVAYPFTNGAGKRYTSDVSYPASTVRAWDMYGRCGEEIASMEVTLVLQETRPILAVGQPFITSRPNEDLIFPSSWRTSFGGVLVRLAPSPSRVQTAHSTRAAEVYREHEIQAVSHSPRYSFHPRSYHQNLPTASPPPLRRNRSE